MEFYLSFIYAAVCVSCRAALAGMSTNLIRGIKALME